MERVDVVVVGAEGVVENGGIVNKTGTFQTAIVAKAFHKPFYVATESYKFARIFPLSQRDLPEENEISAPLVFKTKGGAIDGEEDEEDDGTCFNVGDALAPQSPVTGVSPACDYTPANYITLLFTDLGVLTPSAVSDELIKLYQ
jgi:translation initiation factor eIF-2B subunit alpha